MSNYSPLEFLGALLLGSITDVEKGHPLAELIEKAEAELSDELDQAQYDWWVANGTPEFRVT